MGNTETSTSSHVDSYKGANLFSVSWFTSFNSVVQFLRKCRQAVSARSCLDNSALRPAT